MRTLTLLIVMLVTAGCGSIATPPAPLVMRGDAQRGEMIYRQGINNAPPCMGCHALAAGGFSLGPVMAGVRERAGRRIEGLDAEAYIRQSILEPTAYIVPGYRNLMYTAYGEHLTEQDIVDLMAFLGTLPP